MEKFPLPPFTGNTFAVLTLFTAALLFSSCSKDQEREVELTQSSKSNESSVSAVQALPGGKTNFSAVVGNMDLTGSTVVRIGNYTFSGSAGTVAYTYWEWNSTAEKGKTLFNAHTCTFEGISKTANPYTPTGWMLPSGQYVSRTGIYTFNTTTNVLSIAWNAPWSGVSESWDVTNPDGLTAKLVIRSNNYGLTHGKGYGSNASWSTFKTVVQVPRVSYPGTYVIATKGTLSTVTVTPAGAGNWSSGPMDLTLFTSSSNANTYHYRSASTSSGVCTAGGGCTTTREGIIYHLASNNNGRSMVYNHFCACLPTDQEFPTYNRNLHPYAMQQIIDDNGVMRGFVGIEQQDEPGSVGYQYQLREYFLP